MRAPEVEEVSHQRKNRGFILAHYRHIAQLVVGCDRQPGLMLRKARERTRVPLHRRSRGIAPGPCAGLTLPPWILDAIWRDLDMPNGEFVAIVECWRAAQGQEQHGCHGSLFRASARRYAGPVVIAENPIWPGAFRQSRLIIPDQFSDVPRRPGGA